MLSSSAPTSSEDIWFSDNNLVIYKSFSLNLKKVKFLTINWTICSGTLEGERQRPSYQELLNDPMLKFSGAYQEGHSDLYVTCRIYSDGRPLSLAVSTSYKAFSTRWNWNEWITLPLKFSDLPRNAMMAMTIWDIYGTNKAIPVGGTAISLFGKRGTFRKGMIDLKVWPNVEADPQNHSTTPGKTKDTNDQMSRLAKLSKKHRDGHMVKVDWLDRLTFREIELINEKQKRDSNFMYLMIEFPYVHYNDLQYTVIYFEKGGDEPYQYRTQAEIVCVPDPEIMTENLVESKHHKLARSLHSGPTDRDMKPDAKTRDQLNAIVGFPPTKMLTSEEQDLVWKFRFYLSSQKKALTKFLKCVNWKMPQEAKQAIELMSRWSPMDADDALELLSPAFTHPTVRKYAVSRLRQSDDEDLFLYLFQLVQALRYEDFDKIKHDTDQISTRRESICDTSDRDRTHTMLTRAGSHDSIIDALGGVSPKQEESPEMKLSKESDLASFLIERACDNSTLANYFYWYVSVECENDESTAKEQRVNEMYLCIMKRFSQALVKGGQECRLKRATLARQQMFIERLVSMVKAVTRESGNRKKKIERLRALLQDPEVTKINFASFDDLPLPLDPNIKVNGICVEKATLLKSALMPCRLTFKTSTGGEYVTMFKHGDDLRQDQLILQIITLMDKLLQTENLDLKLTPYKVLATSSKHGFLQMIEECLPLAELLATDGTIHNFLKKHAPMEGAAYGISPEVIDNYIKSCAGYCVVTYLLGVGDRHLDNLLLTKNGKLFHVDFGYILGRDPKVLPPPMRLSREMVDAMGGTNSDHFHDFKKHCYTSFLALRRSANLILNLFALVVDASIPDIALEPDKTVKKVQDKFVLHLNDEEAVHYMQNLIEISVTAMMAAVFENLHKMAQLLQTENLDLKLTPYKVLATSSKHGFLQMIEECLPLAELLATDGTIHNFLKKHAPMEGAAYGISPEVIDNYIKSCAGYCVVTYLLGVGDRHLDNLLLTKNGKLFHVDFGYILGRDPKVLPPPMRLSREMVDAMGGTNSDHFHDFKKHCYTSFLALRRSANLILNLFALVVDASIPDIALEPDKTVKKVQDKFVLHLNDEEAVHYMQNLIEISVTAMMAAVFENLHKMAQYWRK